MRMAFYSVCAFVGKKLFICNQFFLQNTCDVSTCCSLTESLYRNEYVYGAERTYVRVLLVFTIRFHYFNALHDVRYLSFLDFVNKYSFCSVCPL